MPKFNQLTKREQQHARQLTEQAWAAGLTDATVSQVAQDLDGWETRIREAQSAK
ncbi:hypothetical protein [Polymorphospora sp. NPDC050346]|uniref:hypothetical protein n=1 Tax=Polymorphospora sp. NPDC050346 TaxID=3155780 RepID=UPI0033E283A5